VKLAGTAPAADQPLAHLFVARIKWGISPAIVAVYVAYHVDKQIDPMLPDNGSGGSWRFPQRLISCLFFALLVAGFSASPTLSITQSRSSWPTDKLRIVILGTTLIIGLTMALVGEFWLIKPKPTPE
jgi:hypothetical protein